MFYDAQLWLQRAYNTEYVVVFCVWGGVVVGMQTPPSILPPEIYHRNRTPNPKRRHHPPQKTIPHSVHRHDNSDSRLLRAPVHFAARFEYNGRSKCVKRDLHLRVVWKSPLFLSGGGESD